MCTQVTFIDCGCTVLAMIFDVSSLPVLPYSAPLMLWWETMLALEAWSHFWSKCQYTREAADAYCLLVFQVIVDENPAIKDIKAPMLDISIVPTMKNTMRHQEAIGQIVER